MTITTSDLLTGKALTTAVTDVIKQGKDFEQRLHLVACSAIQHSIKHHNTTPLDTLIRGVTGAVRRNALIAWAVKFGECKPAEDGKGVDHLKKEGDLDGAMALPFWEFKPEQPFTAFDLGAELAKLVARAEKAAKDERNSLPEAGFRELRELQSKVKPLAKVAA
jgi:hypothetical protein